MRDGRVAFAAAAEQLQRRGCCCCCYAATAAARLLVIVATESGLLRPLPCSSGGLRERVELQSIDRGELLQHVRRAQRGLKETGTEAESERHRDTERVRAALANKKIQKNEPNKANE